MFLRRVLAVLLVAAIIFGGFLVSMAGGPGATVVIIGSVVLIGLMGLIS